MGVKTISGPNRRTLTPIKTKFKGYYFRSRLEAKWATFMDILGLRWIYEPQGYALDEGLYYLPDFRIKPNRACDLNCFLEIKWDQPTELEKRKAGLLAAQSNMEVFVIVGEVGDMESLNDSVCLSQADNNGINLGYEYVVKNGYFWCQCPVCGKIGIEYYGRAAMLPCGCIRKAGLQEDKSYFDTLNIKAAIAAARGKRFEKLND